MSCRYCNTVQGEPVPGDLAVLPNDGIDLERELALAIAKLDWYTVRPHTYGREYLMASCEALASAGLYTDEIEETTKEYDIDWDCSTIQINVVPHENKRFNRYDGFSAH
jgi:hypothetical protein